MARAETWGSQTEELVRHSQMFETYTEGTGEPLKNGGQSNYDLVCILGKSLGLWPDVFRDLIVEATLW